jgi:hypothetical protein
MLWAASVHAADTTQRTDPVDPACLRRDAPPEKCVIDDGPAPRPPAAGTQVPQTPPVTPPALPSAGTATDGGGQKAPPLAKTLRGTHK